MRGRCRFLLGLWALLQLGTAFATAPARPAPAWGAIASHARGYGWTLDQPSRAAAEREALARCERSIGPGERCELRTAFDRSCAALAGGNHGEWAVAGGATREAAARDAAARCDAHLPTEPCRMLVSVCSGAPAPGADRADAGRAVPRR
ncbi:MAG: DUF4189 domain-containing protein [Comamonadaceae bacterium]|nr:MAG: DUF4189 domain-containing protein [Comamonadaceae bacterium]